MLGSGAPLCSKTPGLVQQELHGLLLAHFAVRRLIHEAAGQGGEDPDRLSFLHAANLIRCRIEHPGASPWISRIVSSRLRRIAPVCSAILTRVSCLRTVETARP